MRLKPLDWVYKSCFCFGVYSVSIQIINHKMTEGKGPVKTFSIHQLWQQGELIYNCCWAEGVVMRGEISRSASSIHLSKQFVYSIIAQGDVEVLKPILYTM